MMFLTNYAFQVQRFVYFCLVGLVLLQLLWCRLCCNVDCTVMKISAHLCCNSLLSCVQLCSSAAVYSSMHSYAAQLRLLLPLYILILIYCTVLPAVRKLTTVMTELTDVNDHCFDT